MILTVLRIENLSADLEHERLKKSKADAVAVWCSGNALLYIEPGYARFTLTRIIRAIIVRKQWRQRLVNIGGGMNCSFPSPPVLSVPFPPLPSRPSPLRSRAP